MDLTSTDLVYWPLVDYIVKVHDKMSFSHFDKYTKLKPIITKNFLEKKRVYLYQNYTMLIHKLFTNQKL